MSTSIYRLINSQQRFNTTAAVFQESLAAQLGLSIKELYTLAILFDEHAISTGELAERLSITPAAITKITDKLISRRHIKRSADEKDRRKVIISIDHVDTDLVSAAAQEYTAQLVDLTGQFSSMEQAAIDQYLEQVTMLMRDHIASTDGR